MGNSSKRKNTEGEAVGTSKGVSNITSQKQTEERDQQPADYRGAIFNNAAYMVIVTSEDGNITMFNPAAERALGYTAAECIGKLAPTVFHHPDEIAERARMLSAELGFTIAPGFEVLVAKARYNLDNEYDWTFIRKDGSRFPGRLSVTVLRDLQENIIGFLGIAIDITKSKRDEEDLKSNLWFFENMDRINRVMQATDNLEQMMSDVLDAMISIFNCDRAFLATPCDPEQPEFTIAMERTTPQYPGAFSRGVKVPMSDDVKKLFHELLGNPGPNEIYVGKGLEPEDIVWKTYGIKSQLAIAIYPKVGSPWECGLHQCSHNRKWKPREKKLFLEISRRLADGLTSLLSYRDLRRNEKFLDNIVEYIPDMVFVKDAKTLKFVRINKAGEKLLGYQREDLLGKSDYDFFPQEIADFFTSKDHQVLESKELVEIPEEKIRSRKKEERILHTKKIPILDETGTPLYLLGISEDITKQKQAEESIRKLSQAINQSPVSIIITNTSGKIEFVNAKFSQITGYTFDEVVGRTPNILKSGKTPTEEYRRLWKTIGSGDVWQGELQNRKKTGELFWEQATIAPVRNADNVISHYLAMKEDITDRKKLEEQIRQTQKMEAVGQLAGGVAHDFNNMLGVIIGYAELTLANKNLDDTIRKHLQEILAAGHRSSDITRQLLAFARKQTIAPKVLDLNETVEGMLKLLRRIIGEDIDLAWIPGAKLWPIKMDPSQIDQILANLCVNARDAINGVGRITIETQKAVFDDAYCSDHRGFHPGDYVMLAISDSGYGMDQKTIDKIFEPFFTTKGLGKGTGLGLATVYGIIKQNEGFINVYSEPGSGSTFKIYMPRFKGVSSSESVVAPKVEDLSGDETILVVEDEILHLELVKAELETFGYQILAASAPSEALSVAKRHRGKIHLLLTDLVMPEMNGRDLANEMTSRFPGILCLFMSGYTNNVIVHQGILDKGVHFIQKPFSMQNLAGKVREMLDDGQP